MMRKIAMKTAQYSFGDPGKPRTEDSVTYRTGKQVNFAAVLDGVGGYASLGIDSGAYSRCIARGLLMHADGGAIKDTLRASARGCDIKGATTTVAMQIRNRAGKKLHQEVEIMQLGDGAALHLRREFVDGSMVWRARLHTPEQTHNFDQPYQLARHSIKAIDTGDDYIVDVLLGDIFVLGSDGVFDNLYDRDVVKILNDAGGSYDVEQMAKAIAMLAKETSERDDVRIPFTDSLERVTRLDAKLGGKVDDIAVAVVEIIVADNAEPTVFCTPE